MNENPRQEGEGDELAALARAVAGDPQAQAEVINRYKRLVYSIPRRYRLPHDACDDVFQNVFVRFFRALPSITDHRAIPKWLMTTTHRECWRIARQRLPESDWHADLRTDQVPVDRLADWEEQARVQTALVELGGRCERLLRALFMSRTERSYDVIAEDVGIPVGSIGPTRSRCLGKLAELLRLSSDR